MLDHNVKTIHQVAVRFAIPLPDDVIKSAAVAEAATELRDKIAAEVAPDLGNLTASSLTKTHATLVAYESKDARLKAAEAIVTATTDAHSQASFETTQRLRAPLTDLFNERARAFTSLLAAMGGSPDLTPVNGTMFTDIQALANDLNSLRSARNAYANLGVRADAGHSRFEMASRTFRVAGTGHPDTLRFIDTTTDLKFWVAGITAGHAIAWQDVPAQQANWSDCEKRW